MIKGSLKHRELSEAYLVDMALGGIQVEDLVGDLDLRQLGGKHERPFAAAPITAGHASGVL